MVDHPDKSRDALQHAVESFGEFLENRLRRFDKRIDDNRGAYLNYERDLIHNLLSTERGELKVIVEEFERIFKR
jgi:hypothetical protein